MTHTVEMAPTIRASGDFDYVSDLKVCKIVLIFLHTHSLSDKSIHPSINLLKKEIQKNMWGAWVAQLVECPTLNFY